MHNYSNSFATNIRTAEFAQMCGTTKRTLVHYENIGLFSPARRDENGYRYYSEQQYEVFQIIDTLKCLGMPLQEIKAYLEQRSPSGLQAMLEQQAQQVEAELEKLRRIQRIIATKRALLKEGSQVSCGTVTFRQVPEEYLVLSEPVNSAEQASAVLCRHLAACSRDGYCSGHPFGAMIASEDVCHGFFSRYAYFFTKFDADIAPANCYRKPAGLYATLYLKGDYHRCEAAYRQLLGAIDERGLQPTGYSYKEGIIDEIAAKDASQFITRISIAVS